MNKNLEDYIIKFDKKIDYSICNKTLKAISNQEWQKHEWSSTNYKNLGSFSTDPYVGFNFSFEENNHIYNCVEQCLVDYVNTLNFNWFPGGSDFSEIRYNKYSENTEMNNHCDHITSLFDGEKKGIPILSILGLLNDNFHGGELIFFEDTKIDFKQGDIIIFPSNFLYPHKVNPVTKGTRFSFVSWAW